MPLPSRPGFPEQVPGVEPTRPAVGLAGERALPVRRGGRCRDPRPVDLEGVPVLSGRSARQDGVPTADPRPVDLEGVPVLSGRSARQDGVPARAQKCRSSSRRTFASNSATRELSNTLASTTPKRLRTWSSRAATRSRSRDSTDSRRDGVRREQTRKAVTSAVCAVSTRTWQSGTAESRCRWGHTRSRARYRGQ